MRPTLVPRVLIAASIVVVTIGLLDTAIAEEWDMFAVVAIIGVLQLSLWTQLHSHRPAIPIRADLVRWLRARGHAMDEPAEHIADRAIAAYRAGLVDDAPEQVVIREA